MSEGVERLCVWCEDAELPCREDGGALHVLLDADDSGEVRLLLDPEDGRLRIFDAVPLSTADLSADRLVEVVEDVVLSRSSLIDARVGADGQGAEVVLVIHAEGLNQHTFLEAVFEIQKVRLLLHREVGAALAAERTLAALASMASQAWAHERSAVSA